MVPVLEGTAVRLRPWRREDAPAVARACADPQVQRWVDVPSPYALSDATAYVDAHAGAQRVGAPPGGEAGELAWCIEHEGRVAGSVGLGPAVGGRRTTGFWVAPEARGRGLASQALALVTRHAVVDLGAERVQAWHLPGNTASCRTLARGGLASEGVLRGALPFRGALVDAEVHGLDAREWLDAAVTLEGPVLGRPGDPTWLRPLRRADLAALATLADDPEVHAMTPQPSPFGVHDADERVVRWGRGLLGGGPFHWGLCDTGGTLVGTMGVGGRDLPRIGVVGYLVGAAHRRRGHASRGLALLVRWAFDVAGMQRLTLDTVVDNPGSQAVAAAAGFRREAVLRAWATMHGRRLDFVRHGLLATDPRPPLR